MRRPEALFLDRDGLLNELVYYASSNEFESPRSPSDLRIRRGVTEALGKAIEVGIRLFLVSNQPSYAKGKTSLEALWAVHASFKESLEASGIRFVRAYYCYHHPQGIVAGYDGPCACRKPSSFFLRQAAAEYGLELAQCWMVGDQDTDIQCGQAAGCRHIGSPAFRRASKRWSKSFWS